MRKFLLIKCKVYIHGVSVIFAYLVLWMIGMNLSFLDIAVVFRAGKAV